MSRTVRRKNTDKAYRYGERSWTYDVDEEHAKLNGGWKSYISHYTKETTWYFSNVAWGGQKYIPKSDEDYKRGWWDYHNDTLRCWSGGKGPGYYMNGIQRQYRREAVRQIHLAMKDDEYEVILPSKPKRDWWD